MNIYQIFPKYIATSNFSGLIDMEKIKEDSLKYKDLGVKHGAMGGDAVSLHDDENSSILDKPEFSELKDYIQGALLELTDKIKFQFGYMQLGNSWINYMEAGSSTIDHIHGNSLYSGAFYIKANNEQLKLNNTDSADALMYGESNMLVEVETGDLVLFPSFMSHSVKPCEKDRIVLSFNTLHGYPE